jgi:multidrug efflux system membrane fusion protein
LATAALALMVASGLAACSKEETARPAPQAVPVKVGKVARQSVPMTLSAIGTVEASNLVAVRPRVGGVITQVGFREGQPVKKGDLLFRIDPRPYQAALDQAQQALARDQAKSDAAQADLARYERLVAKEFVTREQYENQKAEAASLKATLGADRAAVQAARLDLAFCTIEAPESGRTGALRVREGSLVKANDDGALVTIAKLQPVRVAFSIPEAQIEALRMNPKALTTFVTPKMASTPIQGSLVFIDNQVDTTTGTLLLKAEFPNQDERLWPGQFVDVTLELGNQKDAVTVPSAAVQTGQGGTYVFVIGDDQAAEQRPVKIARRTPELAVIAAGVKPGETVVTDGQLRLTTGTKVSVMGSPASQPSGGALEEAAAPEPGKAVRTR